VAIDDHFAILIHARESGVTTSAVDALAVSFVERLRVAAASNGAGDRKVRWARMSVPRAANTITTAATELSLKGTSFELSSTPLSKRHSTSAGGSFVTAVQRHT
jgi:hypothetical protein